MYYPQNLGWTENVWLRFSCAELQFPGGSRGANFPAQVLIPDPSNQGNQNIGALGAYQTWWANSLGDPIVSKSNSFHNLRHDSFIFQQNAPTNSKNEQPWIGLVQEHGHTAGLQHGARLENQVTRDSPANIPACINTATGTIRSSRSPTDITRSGARIKLLSGLL
jgi:hypothetical protein